MTWEMQYTEIKASGYADVKICDVFLTVLRFPGLQQWNASRSISIAGFPKTGVPIACSVRTSPSILQI
jgi:hypothetical protein